MIASTLRTLWRTLRPTKTSESDISDPFGEREEHVVEARAVIRDPLHAVDLVQQGAGAPRATPPARGRTPRAAPGEGPRRHGRGGWAPPSPGAPPSGGSCAKNSPRLP